MAVAQKKQFDFLKLYEIFIGMCPDFQMERSYETPSVSRLFAEKIIFDFSAQLKSIKKTGRDHTWKVVLKSHNEETTDVIPKKYKIYISTYLFSKSPTDQPQLEGKKLRITFKQASLVAVFKYCQVIPFITQRGEIVFTPLAGAVFRKEFLPEILTQLVTLQRMPVGMHNLLIGIICSCQTDGFYLPYSVCHIAVVAICCTVKDYNLRESLVKSTIKQYQKLGKPFDEQKFKIYIVYAQKQIDVNTLVRVNVLPCEQSKNVLKKNKKKNLDEATPTPPELEEGKTPTENNNEKSCNVMELLKKSGLLRRNESQEHYEQTQCDENSQAKLQNIQPKIYLPKTSNTPIDEENSSDTESSEEEMSEQETSADETTGESDIEEKIARVALKYI